MHLWAHKGLLNSLGNPCSSQTDWSAQSSRDVLKSGLELLGIEPTRDNPVHILVDSSERRLRSQRVKCHVWSGRLPAGSLYQIAPGLLVTSPAFCCLLDGVRSSLPHVASRVMECLGLYGKSDDSRGFKDRDPLFTDDELLSYLMAAKGCPGVDKLRRALGYSMHPARSPLETKAALVLTLPVKLGGYGLMRPELNYLITPRAEDVPFSQFARYEVDICWPERRTVIEVDSTLYHASAEKIDSDAKKRNSLKSMGWKVTSVTSGQLSGDALDVLARQIARDLWVSPKMPKPERRDWLVKELE